MPTYRSNLRQQLKYHTDSKLTSTTDQDYYLTLAEKDVFKDWIKFDPTLFRPALQTGTTDANGMLLMDSSFARLEYLEDTNHRQYFIIPALASVPFGTGYIFLGFDPTTGKRQLLVILNGNPVASTSLRWYDVERVYMASSNPTTDLCIYPDEYSHLIADRAAYLYYKDKGPAFAGFKNEWLSDYERELKKAEQWYRNITKDPQYVQSFEPDSGTARQRLQGYLP